MTKNLITSLLLSLSLIGVCDAGVKEPAPFGPVPSENQVKWQEMEYYAFIRHQWTSNRSSIIERLDEMGYPLFIKPATLGSSIGIGRPANVNMLAPSVEVALNLIGGW